MLCNDLHRYDEAIAEFRKVIDRDPNFAVAHHNLGVALHNKGELDQAIASLEHALVLDPKLADAHYNLGIALGKKGELDEAIIHFAKAVEIDPSNADWHRSLARALAQSSRWPEAASAFSQALQLKPPDHYHWYEYAALVLYTGDVEAYRRACQEMLGRFGDTADPIIAERVSKTCLLMPGAVSDLQLVRRIADRSVSGNEERAEYAWFVLGKALAEYRAGNPANTIDWLQQVPQDEDLQHRNTMRLALLALALHRLKKYQDAAHARAEAQAILADSLPQPDRSLTFVGPGWLDWLHAQILLREIEEVLNTKRETAIATEN